MKIFPVGCFILLSFLLLAFGQSAHCNDNYSVSPSNSPHNEPAANAEPATTDDQSGDQQSSGKGIIEKAGDKYKELLKKTDRLRCSVFSGPRHTICMPSPLKNHYVLSVEIFA